MKCKNRFKKYLVKVAISLLPLFPLPSLPLSQFLLRQDCEVSQAGGERRLTCPPLHTAGQAEGPGRRLREAGQEALWSLPSSLLSPDSPGSVTAKTATALTTCLAEAVDNLRMSLARDTDTRH